MYLYWINKSAYEVTGSCWHIYSLYREIHLCVNVYLNFP